MRKTLCSQDSAGAGKEVGRMVGEGARFSRGRMSAVVVVGRGEVDQNNAFRMIPMSVLLPSS